MALPSLETIKANTEEVAEVAKVVLAVITIVSFVKKRTGTPTPPIDTKDAS